MMNKEYMNISKIETYLAGIIDNVVSNNTYAGTLPTTINAAWSDMVLIDCANAIADMEAYGRGVVLIWLYAKPRTDGTKNVALMSQLEKKLNEVIGAADDRHYIISRRDTFTDYDDARKWHCNIVELNITIV